MIRYYSMDTPPERLTDVDLTGTLRHLEIELGLREHWNPGRICQCW